MDRKIVDNFEGKTIASLTDNQKQAAWSKLRPLRQWSKVQQDTTLELLLEVTDIDRLRNRINDVLNNGHLHAPSIFESVDGKFYVPFKIVLYAVRSDDVYRPYAFLLQDYPVVKKENVTFPEFDVIESIGSDVSTRTTESMSELR